MPTNILRKKLALAVIGGIMAFSTAAGAAPVELALEDSILLALQNNPTIKMADADKKAAEWKISEAKSGKGPSLSYSHTDTRLKVDPGKAGGQKVLKDNYDNTVKLTLPLYTGGKVEGLINQAKFGFKAADLGFEQSKQQVKLDATTAYFNVLQARNMLNLSVESMDRLNAHLKNVQAQYEVGTVAKVDVLRSEVELANAEQNHIKAQNSYDLSLASLNNVIGLSLDTEVKVKDDLDYKPFTESLENCIQFALTNRPEVGQVEANIDVAKAGVKVAKSGRLPTVAVSGSENWNDTEFAGFDNNNWSISLQASLNVFDSNLTRSKVKQADASLNKAEEKARQTKDAVQLDVRQAYFNLREAEKRIATTKVAVSKAEEDYKIAQVRYGAGVGTNIDVIDAQVALTQAKTNYVQALYDYNTSQAKLNKAMGIKVSL